MKFAEVLKKIGSANMGIGAYFLIILKKKNKNKYNPKYWKNRGNNRYSFSFRYRFVNDQDCKYLRILY